MKAVLALILIYVGTFLVAIQGASNSRSKRLYRPARKPP
jgi:hypothetical protein